MQCNIVIVHTCHRLEDRCGKGVGVQGAPPVLDTSCVGGTCDRSELQHQVQEMLLCDAHQSEHRSPCHNRPETGLPLLKWSLEQPSHIYDTLQAVLLETRMEGRLPVTASSVRLTPLWPQLNFKRRINSHARVPLLYDICTRGACLWHLQRGDGLLDHYSVQSAQCGSDTLDRSIAVSDEQSSRSTLLTYTHPPDGGEDVSGLGGRLPLPLLAFKEHGVRLRAPVLQRQGVAHRLILLHQHKRNAAVCERGRGDIAVYDTIRYDAISLKGPWERGTPRGGFTGIRFSDRALQLS